MDYSKDERFRVLCSKVKYQSGEAISLLGKEVAFLEWEQKWYNLWTLFLPEGLNRKIYRRRRNGRY